MSKNKNITKTPKNTIAQSQPLLIGLEIKGTADLIQNCFDQKTIEQMLKKHMGLPIEKEKKVPADCIERAIIYNVKNKICIPPTAIKKAMLTAATQIKSVTKTKLRPSLFIEGGSIPIKYSRMLPRMDMVRTSGQNRAPDVRFRPAFEDWSARLIILFSELIPAEMVIELLQRAGNIGIGEWRPEKDGTFGTFEVSRPINDAKEIEEVRRICRPPLVSLFIPKWAMNIEMTAEIMDKIRSGVS